MLANTIQSIMTTKVVSSTSDAPLSEVIMRMADNNISCMIILDDAHIPVGIITERDIIKLSAQYQNINEFKVGDVMTSPVEVVSKNMDLYEAAIYLKNHNFRRIVFVSNTGKLLGLVTQTNLKNHLGALYFVKFKSIKNIMTEDVITAGYDEKMSKLIRRMSDCNISCLVICEDNKPSGIITERDITRILARKKDIGNVVARGISKSPLITVLENTSIYEATLLMKKKNIRRLVVIDENKCLAGLITETDIVKHLEREYLKSLRNIVNREIKYIDNIKVGIFECTPSIDGIFTWINMTGAQILGYKTNQEVKTKGIANDFNATLKKSDNNLFYAEGTFYFIRDEDDNILCIEGILRNINERKKMEDRLKKYSMQLERTIEERTAESLKTYDELQVEITERMQVEQVLREKDQDLEIKNKSLEETNTALRVLLKKREEDKTELEEKMLSNITDLPA
jgi:CBS domain-containing protein